MEIVTWPARRAGEGLAEAGYPKLGYLLELGGELATFKGLHGAKVKGTSAVKQKGYAKSVFDKKMSALTEAQRAEVRKLADTKLKGRNIVKEERQAKQTPFESAYEVQKDLWFKKRDRRVFEADIEARLLKKEIKEAVGKKQGSQYDQAIQVYIDLKNHPNHYGKYYDKLTPEQRKVVDLSQNLPPEVKTIADKIAQSYKKIGKEALEADVIKNMLENYAGRQWDLGPGKSMEAMRKFGTKTRHAKARRLGTILEGWAEGYNLKIKSATENLRTYKED
jgi:hypothetical protein